MLGGLYHHVTQPREPGAKYGPTNVNYGLLPPLPGTRKDNRKPRMAERAREDLHTWLARKGVVVRTAPTEIVMPA
jgi:folate-dependent tRNA-U54 methylase TrmFO/GidA